MEIKMLRSDCIYKKIALAPVEKKGDIFRYELMQPFKGKLDCYGIPLKADTPGGYDVIMASAMLGFLVPPGIDEGILPQIELLGREDLWENCYKSLCTSLEMFTKAGIDLPVQEYLWSILLGDEASPYTIMNKGYGGDGGIPGYIFGTIVPSEYTLERLPVALAHEVNHNVRFQFQKWRNDITVGEMMICEGLAENFATFLFGEEMVGPWVSATDIETLNTHCKPIIKAGLSVTGLEGITPYLYGDEMAELQQYFPVGLPYCAGYACGYYAVKYYLEKTGKNIVEATVLPAQEILKELEGFWQE